MLKWNTGSAFDIRAYCGIGLFLAAGLQVAIIFVKLALPPSDLALAGANHDLSNMLGTGVMVLLATLALLAFIDADPAMIGWILAFCAAIALAPSYAAQNELHYGRYGISAAVVLLFGAGAYKANQREHAKATPPSAHRR